MRVVVPEEVVMQPRLRIKVLVLQPERLVRAGDIRLAVESARAVVVAEPQQPAVTVGHLARDADLVAVEVVGLLAVFTVFGCPIADLRQRLVGIRVSVDIGIPAVRVDFLQEMAAVPNEVSLVFEVVPA